MKLIQVKNSASLSFLLVANVVLSKAASISSDSDGVKLSTILDANESINDRPTKSSTPNRAHGRIVGGSSASINNFPYQLSLRFRGVHVCGASILNANYALTAAHCQVSNNVGDFSIYAGSADRIEGGSVYPVVFFNIHPSYNQNPSIYDLALIRVGTPFQFSPTIKAVQLPNTPLRALSRVMLSGWGTTKGTNTSSPIELQSAELYTISVQKCRLMMPGVGTGVMCALYPGKVGCSGDSGGPLVRNGVQYGIASSVLVDRRTNECVTGMPTAFADVYVHKDWISNNAV